MCVSFHRPRSITHKSHSQFFDFHTTALPHTLPLPAPASKTLLNRTNNLLAVVSDDFVVRIVDIESKRVVRELSDFQGQVLDIVSFHARF